MVKRLLREPLLHFLLLGAMLFAAHGILSRGGGTEPGRIVVTQGQIESMARLFRAPGNGRRRMLNWKGWSAAMSAKKCCIAKALRRVWTGTIRSSGVGSRRSWNSSPKAPKRSSRATGNSKPTSIHTANCLRSNQEFSFRHVYLDPRRHETTLAADAERMLVELNSPGSRLDAAGLGDPITLPLAFDDASASDIKNSLGNQFVKALAVIAPGAWSGPVESGYGMHLVQVSRRTEPRAPALADVREAVKREWQLTRRAEALEKSYRDLLQRYTVTIEPSRFASDAGDTGSKRSP